jgi:cytochrome c oxidase subunit 2
MFDFGDQASSYAQDIDGLILLIAAIVFFWFFLAEGVFFWLIFKFRRRPGVRGQYITGEKKEEKKWITIPHAIVLLCDVVIIVGAIRVWMNVKQTLPEPHATVRVIGQQWAWTFVQPGPDGQIDTEDDITTIDQLHVEVDKVYHFKLSSKDVLHSFSVPVFRLKQDAVPGREITGWFQPILTGTYDIQCAEMCGIGHGIMGATIVINNASDHAAWVAERAASAPKEEAAPAAPEAAPEAEE